MKTFNITTIMGNCYDTLPFLSSELERVEFNNIGKYGCTTNGLKTTYEAYLNSLNRGKFDVTLTKYDDGSFEQQFRIVWIENDAMSDVEVFKRFMEWMGMKAYKDKKLDDGSTVLQFYDSEEDSDIFTKCGYDDFQAGIIFDENGKMVKGYIDSHVVYSSPNKKLIDKL